MKTNIFFGAGKIGKRELEYWQERGAAPDYFVDNNESRWGDSYYGIPIISLAEAKTIHDAWFWITCADQEGVKKQILSEGIDETQIRNKYNFSDIFYAYSQNKGFLNSFPPVEVYNTKTKRKVIFDLEYGLTLGGAETWIVEMTGRLRDKGHDIKYLTNDRATNLLEAGDAELMELGYNDENSVEERVRKGINTILQCLPCNMICNFPETNLVAACIVKKLFPESINIIAVVHCDQQDYYDKFGLWQECIDHVLVISEKMKKIMSGVFKEHSKIHYLGWHIPCEDTINRTYSNENEPIRIGYAGRVLIFQKRSDLLFEIAEKMKKNQIDYIMEVAGTGDYEQEMRELVQAHGMENNVKLLGLIDRTEIPEFWKRQDIAISCSDIEGRSITKAEAMASGAVPVITDTSGARDDIIDGWNGYVLECGRWEPFVETIDTLSKDRQKIAAMGRNAHQTILDNNDKNSKSDLWERILI